MDTSESFIRKIKIKYTQDGKQPTDYRLSKLLGMSPQGIHSFNTRGSVFDDKAGLQIAKLLNLDPAYVLMCLGAERTKDANAKKTYERIAKVFQYAASTALLLVLTLVYSPLQNHQMALGEFLKAPTMYIMSNVRTWLLGLIRRFGGIFSTLSQHRFCNVPG